MNKKMNVSSAKGTSSMDGLIERHCAELDRCNQRGGRMLSIFDLIDAKTVDPDLAAFLMARISKGKSCMVGAVPGGAGKTTVMCALVNLAPADVEFVAAVPAAVSSAGGPPGRKCYICHEIGSGPYYAYLWGAELREYCGLYQKGHMLATNLHADDIDEARDQVCCTNGVDEISFNGFNVLVFLRMTGGFRRVERVVEKVYVSDGTNPHVLVYDRATGLHRSASPDLSDIDDRWEEKCREFLDGHIEDGTRTIEQTRRTVTAFLSSESP